MTLPGPIRRLVDSILGWGPVATTRRVLDRYSAAGGGLLAGGLTYSALFALLPALLLLTGILGLIVDDVDRRRAIVEGIGESLPPLRGFLDASLEQLTEGAANAGTIGLIGLAWGTSRFYGSLDDAFGRILRAEARRGFLAQTFRGILSVLLLISVFLAALVLTGVASFLAEQTASRFGADTRAFWGVTTPLLTLLVFVAGMAIIYRAVPASHVPWGTLLLPAVTVGVALTILTQAFSYVAPRLIGTAAIYGTFVALFAAMIWLSTGFQLILLGAAWIADRLAGRSPGPAPD